MNLSNILIVLVIASANSLVLAQPSCTKDGLGRVFCAPPGGSAVPTLSGVVCGPGHCIITDLGKIVCSAQPGGGAIMDDLGRPICIGGCVPASKDFCQITSN